MLKTISIRTAAALTMPLTIFENETAKRKKHFITLSFDDGFKKYSHLNKSYLPASEPGYSVFVMF